MREKIISVPLFPRAKKRDDIEKRIFKHIRVLKKYIYLFRLIFRKHAVTISIKAFKM